MVDARKKLNVRTINQISMDVSLGIPEDMIELFHWIRWGEKDVEMALELWKHATDPSPLHPPLRRPPSRRVLAMARCLQAYVYRERAFIGEETLQTDGMLCAAKAADASAALGLVAPIMLLVARFLDGPLGMHGDASLRELLQLSQLTEWRRHKPMRKPGCPYKGGIANNTAIEDGSMNPPWGA
ncbi:hypothetical protein DAEQUDRAFT_735471 [Daedalea quercina L-15889]|uniref:Uncharacterized protein n=1 Tax=Daedalea quercina L-15889 TaxID=1314783 RepID=A0A165TDI6_9APHY|nr:hypothetical protein DAEQUDRAFT_735471 [Daedalea quercina L-15889]